MPPIWALPDVSGASLARALRYIDAKAGDFQSQLFMS